MVWITRRFVGYIAMKRMKRYWPFSRCYWIYCPLKLYFQTCISSSSHSSLQLTFPRAKAFEKPVFLGYSLGQLQYFPNSSIIQSAKLFILHYMVDLNIPNGHALSIEFESKLRRYFAELSGNSRMQYSLLSRRRELEEQRLILVNFLVLLYFQSHILDFTTISGPDGTCIIDFHALNPDATTFI